MVVLRTRFRVPYMYGDVFLLHVPFSFLHDTLGDFILHVPFSLFVHLTWLVLFILLVHIILFVPYILLVPFILFVLFLFSRLILSLPEHGDEWQLLL